MVETAVEQAPSKSKRTLVMERRWQDPLFRQKMSQPRHEAVKRAISIALKGKKYSDEERIAMNWARGAISARVRPLILEGKSPAEITAMLSDVKLPQVHRAIRTLKEAGDIPRPTTEQTQGYRQGIGESISISKVLIHRKLFNPQEDRPLLLNLYNQAQRKPPIGSDTIVLAAFYKALRAMADEEFGRIGEVMDVLQSKPKLLPKPEEVIFIIGQTPIPARVFFKRIEDRYKGTPWQGYSAVNRSAVPDIFGLGGVLPTERMDELIGRYFPVGKYWFGAHDLCQFQSNFFNLF